MDKISDKHQWKTMNKKFFFIKNGTPLLKKHTCIMKKVMHWKNQVIVLITFVEAFMCIHYDVSSSNTIKKLQIMRKKKLAMKGKDKIIFLLCTQSTCGKMFKGPSNGWKNKKKKSKMSKAFRNWSKSNYSFIKLNDSRFWYQHDFQQRVWLELSVIFQIIALHSFV